MSNSWDTNKYYKKTPVPKTRRPTSSYDSVDKAIAETRGGPAAAARQGYYNQVMNTQRDLWREHGPGRGSFNAARGITDYNIDMLGAGQQPPGDPDDPGGLGSGGGGWGGGGGGGASAAALAQGQLDFLMQLLGNKKTYTATPDTAQRASIAKASAADQAAANAAYGGLDKWLGAHNTNPYADVKLQNARLAPDANPYLQSQGVDALAPVTRNPEDVGANAAFSNVLKLLGAGERSSQQSRAAESRMGRTFANTEIGGADNAMLAQIAAQDAARQEALNTERRQAMLQLAALVGQGAKAPNLANFKW